ncbi:GroES-like protein [Ramaria rubella]|nr:GroES-like protein [Ramaria rubella]
MPQQKVHFLQAKQGAFEVASSTIPQPGSDDVLVKILATALNPVDWKIQKYGIFVDKYPAILGTDSAGTVEQVGENVKTFKKGDRVVHQGYFTNDKATFQEYTTVPAEILAKIPENISFDQAASVPLGLATAAVGFYNPPSGNGAGLTPPWVPAGEGKYQGGIVIFGGSTSVGQYGECHHFSRDRLNLSSLALVAIQLARLSGFSPIVTTASLHNADLVKSLGATHVIDRKADVVAEAKKILTPLPDIVYDAVSEDTQEQAWNILASNGTLILVLPGKEVLKNGEDGKKHISIFGNVHIQRELGKSLYANLTGLLQSGKIKPNRVEVIPGGLGGIVSGLKRMEENKVSGVKLVVRPQETA